MFKTNKIKKHNKNNNITFNCKSSISKIEDNSNDNSYDKSNDNNNDNSSDNSYDNSTNRSQCTDNSIADNNTYNYGVPHRHELMLRSQANVNKIKYNQQIIHQSEHWDENNGMQSSAQTNGSNQHIMNSHKDPVKNDSTVQCANNMYSYHNKNNGYLYDHNRIARDASHHLQLHGINETEQRDVSRRMNVSSNSHNKILRRYITNGQISEINRMNPLHHQRTKIYASHPKTVQIDPLRMHNNNKQTSFDVQQTHNNTNIMGQRHVADTSLCNDKIKRKNNKIVKRNLAAMFSESDDGCGHDFNSQDFVIHIPQFKKQRRSSRKPKSKKNLMRIGPSLPIFNEEDSDIDSI